MYEVQYHVNTRSVARTDYFTFIYHFQVILRRDDIKLFKRFLDLHAAMMELKWVYECASSVSDVSSLNGSNMSLDDVTHGPREPCFPIDEQDTQFRERTTSLLIPRKSRATRIRWKSNEII